MEDSEERWLRRSLVTAPAKISPSWKCSCTFQDEAALAVARRASSTVTAFPYLNTRIYAAFDAVCVRKSCDCGIS